MLYTDKDFEQLTKEAFAVGPKQDEISMIIRGPDEEAEEFKEELNKLATHFED